MRITNETLARFVAIKTQIKQLEKEAEAIKESLIAKGPFETSEFVVLVDTVEVNRTIDADTLCTILDPVFVAKNNLIRTSSYEKVQVKAKKPERKIA